MKLDAFELTYYPPAVTVQYRSKHKQGLISKRIDIPHCISSLNACIEYLAQSHRFLAYYKTQTRYIASTLLAAQEINTKYKYVPRAVVANEILPTTSCKLDKFGEVCIVTSHDRTAKVYDLSSIKTSKAALHEKHILEGHEGIVYGASLSYPEATLCATASFDGSCRIWDVETGNSLGLLTIPDNVREVLAVQFLHANSNYLATGDAAGSVFLWDVNRTNDPIASLANIHAEEVIAILCDIRSENRLLTASFDGSVQLHDLRIPISASMTGSTLLNSSSSTTSSRVLTKHPGEITAVDSDPNLTMVVSASSDGLYRVTDIRAPETPLYEHNFKSEIISCSMSLGKQYTALSISHGEGGSGEDIILPEPPERKKEHKKKKGDVDVYIVDNDHHTLAGVLHGHVGEVTLTKFVAPGYGNRIITSSNDRTLRIWSGPDDPKKSCTEVARLDGHMDAVTTFDVSYDASVIVSTSTDNIFRVWGVK